MISGKIKSDKVTFEVIKNLLYTSIYQNFPWAVNDLVDLYIRSVTEIKYGRYQTGAPGKVKLTPDELVDLLAEGVIRLISTDPENPTKDQLVMLGFGDVGKVLGDRVVTWKAGLGFQTKTTAEEFYTEPFEDDLIPADAETILSAMMQRGWFGSANDLLTVKTTPSYMGPGADRRIRTPKHQIQASGVRVWNPWLGTDFAARTFDIDKDRMQHKSFHGPHPDYEDSKVLRLNGVMQYPAGSAFALSFSFWEKNQDLWDAEIEKANNA